MHCNTCPRIITFLLLSIIRKVAECAVYKAGVVEYYYDIESKLDPKQSLDNNVRKYDEIAGSFSKTWPEITNGILVFPECGLSNQQNLNVTGVFVPEPDYRNSNFSQYKVIGPLSHTANTFRIWLVVNLIEKDGDKFYNTDVVFANNGTIAAKYRKYNLYGEPVDRPSKAEVVSFTTDFNVTFGIFTCFDILYPHPALDLVKKGISNVIFPTAWYSELPFLTAVQYQKSWSWTNDVTLFASGLSYSKVGNTGSGIYGGRSGDDLYFQSTDTSDSKILMVSFETSKKGLFVDRHSGTIPEGVLESQSQELINTVEFSYSEKKQNDIDIKDEVSSQLNINNLLIKQEPLDIYTTSLITPNGCKLSDDLTPGHIINCTTNIVEKLCNHDFCCQFKVTAIFSLYVCVEDDCLDAEKYHPTTFAEDDFSLSEHRLAAFNGVRSFGVATAGCQTCAVVSCRNNDVSSCGLTAVPTSINCYPYTDTHNVCVLRRYITYVDIGGNFSEDNTFITPNLLLRGDSQASQFGKVSNDFVMTNTNGYYNLVFKVPSEDVLGTAAIWSRVFERDGQQVTGTSSSTSFSIFVVLTVVLIYPTLKYLRFV